MVLLLSSDSDETVDEANVETSAAIITHWSVTQSRIVRICSLQLPSWNIPFAEELPSGRFTLPENLILGTLPWQNIGLRNICRARTIVLQGLQFSRQMPCVVNIKELCQRMLLYELLQNCPSSLNCPLWILPCQRIVRREHYPFRELSFMDTTLAENCLSWTLPCQLIVLREP